MKTGNETEVAGGAQSPAGVDVEAAAERVAEQPIQGELPHGKKRAKRAGQGKVPATSLRDPLSTADKRFIVTTALLGLVAVLLIATLVVVAVMKDETEDGILSLASEVGKVGTAVAKNGEVLNKVSSDTSTIAGGVLDLKTGLGIVAENIGMPPTYVVKGKKEYGTVFSELTALRRRTNGIGGFLGKFDRKGNTAAKVLEAVAHATGATEAVAPETKEEGEEGEEAEEVTKVTPASGTVTCRGESNIPAKCVIRAAPNGEAVKDVPAGTKGIKLLGFNQDQKWSQVEWEGKTGFCWSKDLQMEIKTANPELIPTPATAVPAAVAPVPAPAAPQAAPVPASAPAVEKPAEAVPAAAPAAAPQAAPAEKKFDVDVIDAPAKQ